MERNVRIIIEYDKDVEWKVTVGDKYADKLYWEEMIGLISSVTMLEGKPCLGWLLTQEQHETRNEKFNSTINKIKDICQE